MKRTRLIVWIATLACVLFPTLLAAQNPCDVYNFDRYDTLLNYPDYTQHVGGVGNGDHNANLQGYMSAQYSGDNINVPCEVLLDVYPSGNVNDDEWGSLASIFDCHPIAIGYKSGSYFGPSGGSATTAMVFGVNNGLMVSGVCTRSPLTVTVAGVGSYSFSPNDKLWAAEHDFQAAAPQQYPTSCSPPPQGCGEKYTWDYQTCQCKYEGGSPILIDTTRTGFKLSPPFKSQRQLQAEHQGVAWKGDDRDVPSNEQGCVDFDLKGDGNKACWSWPIAGSGNGWLVRINNGTIDNGTKLFGDHTPVGCVETTNDGKPLPRGYWNCAADQPKNERIRSGYFALTEFDMVQNGGNGDFVLNSDDEVWKYLRICIDDSPRDGVCTFNELHTLGEFGIHSISLVAVVSRRQDQWGNSFKYAAELNADPATVRDHAQAIHEQALVNEAKHDVDIVALPHDPWLSYDVWLVNSDR